MRYKDKIRALLPGCYRSLPHCVRLQMMLSCQPHFPLACHWLGGVPRQRTRLVQTRRAGRFMLLWLIERLLPSTDKDERTDEIEQQGYILGFQTKLSVGRRGLSPPPPRFLSPPLTHV